ncbi:50S ribosomal protein L21 [Candidatus Peregrinibacteria bacterium]|nr:MAG: 50S ribosomal protein L21 [Candidatus Peregrinibacteria bacterium]
MFAIFTTGGKQYRAEKGGVLRVEKLLEAEGEEVIFPEVFLVSDEKKTDIGTPFVTGARVVAKIKQQGKNDKIRVLKFQPKKRHKIVRGHRQSFTEIEVVNIVTGAPQKKAEKTSSPENETPETSS